MDDRAGIINQSSYNNDSSKTAIGNMLGNIVNHMMQKATEEGILFDIVTIGDVSELTDTTISEIKLETLFADLIENAIIATSYSEQKRVLIMFDKNDEGIYELSVQDSGIPFNIDTLLNLGIKKTTTHQNDGGSGIGYMTIFEIINECKASLVIAEYEFGEHDFTKSVTIRFDGMDSYIVKSARAEDIKSLKNEMNIKRNYPIISYG